MNQDNTLLIAGAGLAGSLMALYLAKKGFRVEVYERRPDMRKEEMSAGKSINLALSVRGLNALKEVGMDQEILSICIPMSGRMVHPLNGEKNFQSYSSDGKKAIHSVSRGDLNKRLMTRAEETGVIIHFNYRCTGFDPESGEAEFRNEITGEVSRVKGAALFACDGANSGFRNSLLTRYRLNFSQEFLSHGYKELTMPALPGGKHKMEVNALHIWPRNRYMLIALPNLDGTYTCTLFLPYEGKPGFDMLKTPDSLLSFFKKDFPDALELMPDLADDYFSNPLGYLVTIKCNPWAFEGKAALVGDAAHAMVPFYGQGMNAAFEDCSELSRLIDLHGDDWERIFPAYERNRLPHGNAIQDLALDNFVEMRDRVGDKKWLFKKEIEHLLEKEFPHQYISRYELISFSKVPYAEAEETGERNMEILNMLSQELISANEFDREKASAMIREKLGGRLGRWKETGLID